MGSTENTRGGPARLKHRIEHAAVRRLIRSFAARPLDEARERGARLGRLWHAVDRGHRRLAVANIRLALGVDAVDAARTARACFENIGRTIAEIALAERWEAEIFPRVALEGIGHLRDALALGRGVFILSAHCGNWELVGARIAREVPVTALARPMANPLVDAVVAGQRQLARVRTVDARGSVREVFRALGRGEAVGLLLDQNALRSERVFVDFFGRPASTNFGLAMLALKSGAPVLPAFAVREPGGGHRGVIGPPIPPALEGDRAARIGVTTARYSAAIEAHVRRHPDQWFWVHDRWKRRPDPGEAVWRP
jgi:KDO2-lipid IV(A) lauroyltransferase